MVDKPEDVGIDRVQREGQEDLFDGIPHSQWHGLPVKCALCSFCDFLLFSDSTRTAVSLANITEWKVVGNQLVCNGCTRRTRLASCVAMAKENSPLKPAVFNGTKVVG